MFTVNGSIKLAEEDNYQEGCLPDTAFQVSVDLNFRKETIEGLIEELKIYYGEDYQINPCDDDTSRIDFQRMEDDMGDEASKNQTIAWKEGRVKLWVVTYTMYVEKTESVDLNNYKF